MQSTTSFILVQKFKFLKVAINKWNREEFGQIERKKEECLKKLETIDMLAQGSRLSSDMVVERERIRKNYMLWLKMEEASWKQKFHMDWLKFGNSNTKFFHRMASLRKKKSIIFSLKIGGKIMSTQKGISEALASHFQKLFVEPFVSLIKYLTNRLNGWSTLFLSRRSLKLLKF